MIVLRTFEDDRNEQDQVRSGPASCGFDTWVTRPFDWKLRMGGNRAKRRSVISD
jgi:hypothetical protein